MYVTSTNVDGLYIHNIDKQIVQNIGIHIINTIHGMSMESSFKSIIPCIPFSGVTIKNVELYSVQFDVTSMKFNLSH